MAGRERSRPASGAATAKTARKPAPSVHQGTVAQEASACPAADSTTQTAVNTAALSSRRPAPARATGGRHGGLIIALRPRPPYGRSGRSPSDRLDTRRVSWTGPAYTGVRSAGIRRMSGITSELCLRTARCGNTYRYVEPQPGGWSMSIWWSLHLRREAASVPLARRLLLGTMETAGVDPDISFDLSRRAQRGLCERRRARRGRRPRRGRRGVPGHRLSGRREVPYRSRRLGARLPRPACASHCRTAACASTARAPTAAASATQRRGRPGTLPDRGARRPRPLRATGRAGVRWSASTRS